MVPTPADIDKAALRLAQELDGVLRNCPAAYVSIGTPDKRCVGVAGDVETVRQHLGAALGSDLYGVWRSRDDQRTVFNWIKMPSGTVYLRVAADEAGAGRSLIYLDAPTVPAAAVTTTPPASSPVSAAAPAKSATGSAAPAAAPIPTVTRTFQAPSPSANGTARVQTGSPVPFTRTLALKSPRLSGPDVLAAQNRLIALTLGSAGGQGDGWYGPNTAKTVRDFQAANNLKVTGVLDRATWTLLFSAGAKPFKSVGK
ncbi:peptidoglycan-binding protein [Deinococcus irradiatisoli]|uniref:Peptidoglycan-binding protein n=2 Tax=Deinococcus irradiatisoli TaxID=2202254 RepID=A0A2Z3JM97_9DEIO|nr:peptidoglycan-binding protein [Deinococcus irradiatisoli]